MKMYTVMSVASKVGRGEPVSAGVMVLWGNGAYTGSPPFSSLMVTEGGNWKEAVLCEA